MRSPVGPAPPKRKVGVRLIYSDMPPPNIPVRFPRPSKEKKTPRRVTLLPSIESVPLISRACPLWAGSSRPILALSRPAASPAGLPRWEKLLRCRTKLKSPLGVRSCVWKLNLRSFRSLEGFRTGP